MQTTVQGAATGAKRYGLKKINPKVKVLKLGKMASLSSLASTVPTVQLSKSDDVDAPETADVDAPEVNVIVVKLRDISDGR